MRGQSWQCWSCKTEIVAAMETPFTQVIQAHFKAQHPTILYDARLNKWVMRRRQLGEGENRREA